MYLEPSVDVRDPPSPPAAVPVFHELEGGGAHPGGRGWGEGGGRLVGEGIQLGEDTCNTHTRSLTLVAYNDRLTGSREGP